MTNNKLTIEQLKALITAKKEPAVSPVVSITNVVAKMEEKVNTLPSLEALREELKGKVQDTQSYAGNDSFLKALRAQVNQPEFRSPHITSGESMQGADLDDMDIPMDIPRFGCVVCDCEIDEKGYGYFCELHKHLRGTNFSFVIDHQQERKCSCGNPIMTCDCLPF
jgi:hypothetical protein